MIRILFVSTSTTLGGAEKTLFTLATGLNRREFETVGIVSLKPKGFFAERLQERGIKVDSLGISGFPLPRHARKLRDIILAEKPDVVHAFMYQSIQLSRLLKRFFGAPFKLLGSPRVTYRSRSRPTLWIDRLLKNTDDLLVSESAASRRFLVENLGYDPGKVRVIYNGVAPVSAPPSEGETRRKKTEMALGPGEFLIGAIGRLDEQKGHSVLIEAMSLLPREIPARCAIIGDGPLKAGLETLIRRRGLEGRVRLLGERADALEWLPAFDLFVLPSRWEGLPNVLLEAMSRGRAVVGSGVDGVPELVKDGTNGVLVRPDDPAALARGVVELLKDPARARALGEAAKKTVAERFGLDRMIAGYEAAYRDLAA